MPEKSNFSAESDHLHVYFSLLALLSFAFVKRICARVCMSVSLYICMHLSLLVCLAL